jgi:sugar-phosphatase
MFAGRKFAALLFDMDGTVINSIASAERVWTEWAQRQGLDIAAFLPTIHGVRAIETISRLALRGVDAAHEARELAKAEAADTDGIHPIAGAVAFLASLPPERWAIVTSSPRELALIRMTVAGIPVPAIIVTAEDVSVGKPAPDCFRLAAERLGVDARDCVAFEDAPAGIQAAEAAGATVVVITATHRHPLEVGHARIANYEGIRVVIEDSGMLRLAPSSAVETAEFGRR